jgi:hypothetical protein
LLIELNKTFISSLLNSLKAVPGQLPKVVAVISTRLHRSDRQQQPRPPQSQHDPTPRRCQPRLSTTPGAQHAQEKPPREQPPDAERRPPEAG